MMKKTFSILLAVIMLISCMSVTAFAAEEPTEPGIGTPTDEELADIFLRVSFAAVIANRYFEPGEQAPAELVFWCMQLSSKLSDYMDEEGYFNISYDTYMSLVDSYIPNHADMRAYFVEHEYIDEETDMVRWFAGGIGGWQWMLLNAFADENTYTLTGFVLDPEPCEPEGTEYVDYLYIYDEYVDDTYAVNILEAVTVTVEYTGEDFLVLGYTKADYFVVQEDYYYEDEETGELVYYYSDLVLFDMDGTELAEIYSAVYLEEAEGTEFVTEDGTPLKSVLAKFDGLENYWYVRDEGFSYAVKAEEGVEVAGVGAMTQTWGDLLGDTGTIEPYTGFIYLTIYVIEEIVPGDVNCDGEVSNSDLVMVARFIVGMYEDNAEVSDDIRAAADLNQDGDITNSDLVMIARSIVGA
ncbi:MAG: hypothetical protein E7456_02830 [Ruminococcaceae bacterium]|nr:hypothetical protein [Oscillospiraceae bacterium]